MYSTVNIVKICMLYKIKKFLIRVIQLSELLQLFNSSNIKFRRVDKLFAFSDMS